MSDEISKEQFARYFEGISTPEENRGIKRWCEDDHENILLLSELKEIWVMTGKTPEDFNPNEDVAWQKVSKKIDNYEKGRIRYKKKLSWYISRVAAVFVLGFALYFLFQEKNSSQLSFEKFSSSESKKELLLPDGSKVWLNKNTDLEYEKDFAGEARLVKLNGEAFFEVIKNPDKPFIVKSTFSQVTVLGTSFCYKAYKSQKGNTLIVNSGEVEFSDVDHTNSLVLRKGEKVEFNINENSIKKMENNNKNYLAWKTGILIFENETFEKVIDDISNYYSQPFEFNKVALKSTTLTVTFDNQKLEDVLKVIELTMNVTFQNSSGKIIIN